MASATKLLKTVKSKEEGLISLILKEKVGVLQNMSKNSKSTPHPDIQKTPEGLVHDLSSPLTALILNLEYLVEQDPANKDNKELLNALNSARHMHGMIKNFEIVPTKALFKKPFSAVAEIEKCVQMLEAKLKDAHTTTNINGDKEITLRGNASLFDQIIINLITNAIEAEAKKVTISVKANSTATIITITDNGIGMTLKQQANAFNLFYSTKGEDKGSGLGLYICKQIIENDFGGTISLKSQKAKGTQILINIP